MVARGERNNPPSIYEVGETQSDSLSLNNKRHVLEADVVEKNVRLYKYKVVFISPTTGNSKLTHKCIPVSNYGE